MVKRLAALVVVTSLPLFASAAILYQPTSTTTVGSATAFQVNDQNMLVWELDCSQANIGYIDSITIFGKAQSSATGTYQLYANGRVLRDTTGWGATSYYNRKHTFSPPVYCQNGLMRFVLKEYNYAAASPILYQELGPYTACNTPFPWNSGAGSALPMTNTGTGDTTLIGCPSWIIEGEVATSSVSGSMDFMSDDLDNLLVVIGYGFVFFVFFYVALWTTRSFLR